MKLNKLMAIVIVLSFSSMITTTVYAGKVHLRNCMTVSVDARSYNSGDGSMTVAYKIENIPAGEKATLSCDSDKCKVQIQHLYKGKFDHHHLICPPGYDISSKVSEDDMVCDDYETVCAG